MATGSSRAAVRLAALGLVAITLWACGSRGPSPAPTSTTLPVSIVSLSPESSILGATATPGVAASDVPATPQSTPAPRLTPGPAKQPTVQTKVPAPTPTVAAPMPTGVAPPPAPTTVTIVAAGDIACDPTQNVGQPKDCDQAATAAEIGQLRPTAVLTLGDNQYEVNSLAAYKAVFAPTWGKYKSIIHPTIGNHEYLTASAAGYFAYFGYPAYYAFNLGDWHIISLDSECSHVGGCQAGSPQEKWLLANLAAYPRLCTLVTWHEPRFSSGEHGDASQMTAIWADLVAAHVDVVLTGHNHDYERFVPLNAGGQPDPNGTTEFVVGTGGKNHYGFVAAPLTGEVVRNDTSFGVIDMSLGPTSYSWRFVPAPGYTFSDSGSAGCH